MSFELLDFQLPAVEKLQTAAVEWMTALSQHRPPFTLDEEPIPLLGQLQAITGAGKTPILAAVVGGIGPAIVFWTTKSRVVVQQTARKLRTTYAPLMPEDTVVLDEMPTPDQWRDLFDQQTGLTVWVRTVASWNEPEETRKGDDEARLSLHRPAQDLADERTLWEHLASPSERKRPLWVMYDEGHGQTPVQLDQLLDLAPMGIVAASATPATSKRWKALAEQVQQSKTWGPIYAKAQVSIPTGEVARAGLLKNRVMVHDLNVEDSARIGVVVKRFRELDELAQQSNAGVVPRALYIVERSNVSRGETEAAPIRIWRYLHDECGINADEIAVATDTRDLPKEAQQVADFNGLKPGHRHIIFNKKLEEGWDNPEAYVAYFDDETKSARRMKQLIGRVVRQPDGKPRPQPELNTAYLYVAAPNRGFKDIVKSLQRQLLDEYGADEFGEATIQVSTPDDEPEPIALRGSLPTLELPVWRLSAAGKIDDLLERVRQEGTRKFSRKQLDAPGEVVAHTFALDEQERQIVETATAAAMNVRMANDKFLRDRIGNMSRAARNALKDSALKGDMYQQRSAHGSYAQERLKADARSFVEDFVTRVRYNDDWAGGRVWRPAPWQPRSGDKLQFMRSVHVAYTDARSVLNSDELEFARALDAVGEGWWARNFTTAAQNGYGLELPQKVKGSNTFYPDFLWWIDGTVWALETTGDYILEPKVRGKLLTLEKPKIALVTRGRLSNDLQRREDDTGWTLLRAVPGGVAPRPERFESLPPLLSALREP